LGKLKNELAQVKRELDDGPPGDRLKQLLGPFFDNANVQLQDALAQMVGLKEDWGILAQFYGEAKGADSQAFFETLNHFITNFDKARKDNKRRKALQEKAAEAQKRKEELRAQAIANGKPDPTTKDETGAQPGGELDALIGDMKSGQAFANRLKRGRGAGPPGGLGRGMLPTGAVAGEALMMFGNLKKTGANLR